MTAVFLDTVGLLALWDIADQWHQAADVAFKLLLSRRLSIVTTTFVLAECGNAASRRPYRSRADRLRATLERRRELIAPTDEDWPAGWDAYRRGEGVQAGIVDCISFAVMRRLGISEAFTNDNHFAAAGFTPLF